MFTMKQKLTQLLHHLSLALSAVLVLAVFLTATHAKDVAGLPQKTKVATTDGQVARTADDTMVAKSIGDLHSHVDKTMVKDPGMSKSFGDNSALAARREREEIEEERPLSLKMIEMMFMARLTLAYAFTR